VKKHPERLALPLCHARRKAFAHCANPTHYTWRNADPAKISALYGISQSSVFIGHGHPLA
jgi:hypothetical protein